MLEDFCCINFEDFAGDFPGGFFWALFPTKMRRTNPARKSAKKSGGSKIKIREKSVLPKAGPKESQSLAIFCSKEKRKAFFGGTALGPRKSLRFPATETQGTPTY